MNNLNTDSQSSLQFPTVVDATCATTALLNVGVLVNEPRLQSSADLHPPALNGAVCAAAVLMDNEAICGFSNSLASWCHASSVSICTLSTCLSMAKLPLPKGADVKAKTKCCSALVYEATKTILEL